MDRSTRTTRLIRAMPLSERVRALAGREGAPGGALTPASSRSLASWREQSPFGDPRRFIERLASDGLDEPALLRLLALEDADVEAPPWSRWLEAADTPRWSLRSPPQAPDVPLLARFLDCAERELRGALEVCSPGSGPELEVPGVVRSIVAALTPRLRRLIRPTLALEFQVAALRGELDGERPEQRRAAFAARLASPAVAGALWEEYPVLARQLSVVTRQWCAAGIEVVARLAADWPEIRRALAVPDEVGSLVELSPGRGDTHCGGRSVATLVFSSGFRLVYKPRSMALDVHFGELLEWLARRGAPRLRTPRALDRGAYGWAEHVVHAACGSEGEVERFCERQGAQLALLYVLEATDCHAENVIACGDDPVLVDLETLLQPRVLRARQGAAGALDASVLRVGLVSMTMRDGAGVDYSGLGDLDPRQPAHHRPWLRGSPVRASAYPEALLRGFDAMAALLLRERASLAAEGGPLARFATDPVRVVLRSTDAYALLLRESTHPDCLRDAVERERAFDRLWFETLERPELARVIRHEQIDLWSEDVPYFTATPDSRDLVSSRGERIEGFLTACAMAGVQRRLDALDQELPLQRWILREALAALATDEGRPPLVTDVRPHAALGGPATRDRLVAAARELGARLRARAIEERRGPMWLDVPRSAGRATIVPCGVDLYSGTAGIALFFAALARVGGDPRDGEFADRVIHGVRAALDDFGGTIGGFDGAGGVLFVLSHFAAMRPDDRHAAAAERLVDRIAAGCAADDLLDVVSGSAGAIGGLLAWARVDPGARALAVARQCGEHVLARALAVGEGLAWTCGPERPPLVGYAHGAAGIGAILGELGEALGERRFSEAARAALVFERSLFDPVAGAWLDPEATGERRHRRSWCRGAVGCGLARVQEIRRGADHVVMAELERACTFVRAATESDDSLCHGALGALELLAHEGELKRDDGLRRDVATRAGELLDALERRGPWCGNPRRAETPGLLTGVAGIGYGLLRLAAPELVPSVLTLAPPGRR